MKIKLSKNIQLGIFLLIICASIYLTIESISCSCAQMQPANILIDNNKMYEFETDKQSEVLKIKGLKNNELIYRGILSKEAGCFDRYIGDELYSVKGKDEVYRIVKNDSKYELFKFIKFNDTGKTYTIMDLLKIYDENNDIKNINVFSINEGGVEDKLLKKIKDNKKFIDKILEAKQIQYDPEIANSIYSEIIKKNGVCIKVKFHNGNESEIKYYKNLGYLESELMLFKVGDVEI